MKCSRGPNSGWLWEIARLQQSSDIPRAGKLVGQLTGTVQKQRGPFGVATDDDRL